jgi:hypothetical protein
MEARSAVRLRELAQELPGSPVVQSEAADVSAGGINRRDQYTEQVVNTRPGMNITRRLARQAGKHATSLGIMLCVTAIGQFAIFSQRPSIVLTSDSRGYMRAAAEFATHVDLIHGLRTPGYATVLALLFTFGGWVDYLFVVAAQTVLVVVALIEIYVLLWNVTRRKWMACCIASLLGANLYLLNWERSLLAGSLTFCGVVTVLLCFERFVHAMRVQMALAFALSSVVLVLITPFFLFLPALLLAALFVRVLLAGKQIWHKSLYVLLALAITYGCLSGYLVGQARAHGKLAPAWATQERTVADIPDIFAVWLAQPALDTAASTARAGTSGTSVTSDAGSTGTAVNSERPWMRLLLALSLAEQGLYWLFPLLLIVLVAKVWERPKDPRRFMLSVLALVVASTIVMAALGAQGDWYAERFPVDWALIAVAGIMLLDGFVWFYKSLVGRFVEI